MIRPSPALQRPSRTIFCSQIVSAKRESHPYGEPFGGLTRQLSLSGLLGPRTMRVVVAQAEKWNITLQVLTKLHEEATTSKVLQSGNITR